MQELLDKKDRKLVCLLSQDARMGLAQMAKQVGLSKNAVRYRIDRLRKKGIIKYFSCVLDIGALGFETFTILFEFRSGVHDRGILDTFANHPFANWVATLSGRWDLVAEFVCRDLDHFRSLIQDFLTRFGENLTRFQVFLSFHTIKVSHLPDGLCTEMLSARRSRSGPVETDMVDKQILHKLGRNSEAPYLAIARELGTSIDVVRYRIAKLVKQGVILKFFGEISLPHLGYTEYLYLARLRNLSAQRRHQIESAIRMSKSVTYAFFDASSPYLVLSCAFSSQDGIDTLVGMLKKQFGDVIEEQEYLLLKEHMSFNLFPIGLAQPETSLRT